MKKVLLSAVAVLAFTFGNAQSNQKGTMHVNVMGGFLSGSATLKSDEAGSTKEKYSTTGAQFGANFQYGLAESFSAGIGVEVGTAVLSPKNVNFDPYSDDFYTGYSANTDVSTVKVMLSGRYYFVNKDNFNVYAGPSVGFTTGKEKLSNIGFGYDFGTGVEEKKYSGLNYGINVGGNYYFTDVVGVILNVGYEGSSLKSKQAFTAYDDNDNLYSGEETGKATLGGIKVMAGLALKF